MDQIEFREKWQNETIQQFCSHLAHFSGQKQTDFPISPWTGSVDFYPSHLALIQLATPEFGQRLTVLFNPPETLPLLGSSAKKVDPQRAPHLVKDAVKEVLNLTVGQLKRHLDRAEANCEISLPIQLRGYDALFMRANLTASQFTDQWTVRLGETDILISSSITVYDNQWNPKLELNQENEDDSSIEFF